MSYCTVTGKAYVGQSIDFFGGEPRKNGLWGKRSSGRKKEHLRNALRGSLRHPKFYNAIRAHGVEAFVWSVLEDCAGFTCEQVTQRENYWIEKMNALDGGYNGCFATGPGPWKDQPVQIRRKTRNYSEETLKKLADLARKNKPHLGKPHSKESKVKMSQRHKNISAETRNKMSKSALGNIKRLGKKHSEETKLKIAKAGLGNKNWQGRPAATTQVT